MSKKRIIAFGDVHGCTDELMRLLDKLRYNQSSDCLYFLGDLVDRGPDSHGVVSFIRTMNLKTNGMVQSIMGNHDERMVRYHTHSLKKRKYSNYKIPMRPLSIDKLKVYNSLSDEDFEFLSSMPTYVLLEDINWLLVHAGIEPGKQLSDQDPGKLTHLRYLNAVTHKTVSLEKNYDQPLDSIYWTECYDLPHNVAYGHNVHGLGMPKLDHAPEPNGHLWLAGLDTGCPFGGRLTALILPESGTSISVNNIVQAQARQAYTTSILKIR